jgi:hypothetical protein
MIKSGVSFISNRCRFINTGGKKNALFENVNNHQGSHDKNFFHSAASSSSLQLSSLPFNHRRDENNYEKYNAKVYCNLQTRRGYSVTTKTENASLALGLGAIAATAKAGQYAAAAYKEWKENQPEEPEEDATTNKDQTEDQKGQQQTNSNAKTSDDKQKQNEKRENVFASFFDVGTNYYEGGFEDKMTKREAALILGVRPSSTEKRIKEAHRKLLILNHPDTGGSTFLSGKINEAKDFLIKAKAK